MDLYRGLGVGALIFLIVAAGCGGGGGGFNPNDVTVTVSPASITIPASDQTTLQATVHGLCSSCAPSVLWSIAELQTNGASGAQCNGRAIRNRLVHARMGRLRERMLFRP
jgi:hypothetical protein